MSTPTIEISREMIEKWQEIVDLLAAIMQIPAALIMKVEPPDVVVLVSSESTGNPYEHHEKACLNTGLYCETVMRTHRPLLVADALSDENWRSNPDVRLGMISYLGVPISWPNGEVFGTICVLDRKKNTYSDLWQRLLVQLRDVVEADLRSLVALDTRLKEDAEVKARLEAQVEERTAALTRINARLERDIAERRRAEDALRTSQELLQAIIDNSTAVIFVKDRAGRFLLVNRHFVELFGVSRQAVLDNGLPGVFPDECAEAFRRLGERVLTTGSPSEVEVVVPQADGPHTYLTLKFPLRDDLGVPYAVCGIATDITERKRIEQERIQLLAQEQQARAAAEAAVQMRDEFLSVASHELYTPITSLKLALQSLLRGAQNFPAGPPRLLGVAEHQSRRLVNLIEDLLNVSRIQAGKLELHLEEFDLLALAREVVWRFEAELGQTQSSITWQAEGPVVGVWDKSRIDQVVTNLVLNAIKYGAGRPIEIRVTAVKEMAWLVVADRGIGIEPDRLPHIFERFERGVSARNYGGLGLGLYITQQIVHAHAGSIHVKSQPGAGAVFTVELPRERPSPAPKTD